MSKKLKNKNFQKPILNIKKILYLHDFDGWAIHNVGKLWLKNNLPNIETTFKDFKKVSRRDFSKHDLIWFGILSLYLNFCKFLNSHDLNKSVVAVHDPAELFPQIKNWKPKKNDFNRWWSPSYWIRRKKLKLLRKARYVVTTSREMKTILQKYGIKSYLIPTTSSLPLIDKKKIITKKCDLHSVFNTHPRKNMELMELLQNYCINRLKIKFDLKLGTKILPTKKYTELLDNHEVYICTSFQEGGPLPAMDAMYRGSVVITTPVGQIQDVIEDGKNGFICKTKEEFIERINLLSTDLYLLHKMRIASRDSIHKKRNERIIKQKVLTFLKSCFKNN